MKTTKLFLKMYSRTAVRLCYCCCLLLLFAACSKDNGSNSEEQRIVVGKWEVQNDNAEYGSFEFTDDMKYIIMRREASSQSQSVGVNTVRSEPTSCFFSQGMLSSMDTKVVSATSQPGYIVIFGDYSILGNNNGTINLSLSDFGAISLTINSNTREATVTVIGKTYTAKKAAEMPPNDKTSLLCHTWTFSRCVIVENLVPDDKKQQLMVQYGHDWLQSYEKERYEYYCGMTVTFTRAGTYVIQNPNNPGSSNMAHYWSWNTEEPDCTDYLHESGGHGTSCITTLRPDLLCVTEYHWEDTLVR
jgi:hypothetical protein